MKRLLMFGCIFLILLSACGGGDDTPASEPYPQMSPEQIIERSSPLLEKLDAFHFKLDEEGGGTPINMGLIMMLAEGDIDPPDRGKMRMEADWFGQFVEVKLVTVGTVTYMTNPINGKWELLTNDFTAVTLFEPDTGIRSVMESVTDLVRLESERFSGTRCFRLQGNLDSMALDAIAVGHAVEGLNVETDIWIGASDFLLRKVIFDGRVTKEEEEGIVRTLTLSRFNEPVEIELPE